MSAPEAKKGGDGPDPKKIFLMLAAVGIGLIFLAMGADSLLNMARAISMSFDMLMKPLLSLVVVGGIATMVFSKKGGGDDHKDDKH